MSRLVRRATRIVMASVAPAVVGSWGACAPPTSTAESPASRDGALPDAGFEATPPVDGSPLDGSDLGDGEGGAPEGGLPLPYAKSAATMFEALRTPCTTAGGSFDARTKSCVCPRAGDKLNPFGDGQGACERATLQRKGACAGGFVAGLERLRAEGRERELASCFDKVAEVPGKPYLPLSEPALTTLSVVPIVSEAEAKSGALDALARWADTVSGDGADALGGLFLSASIGDDVLVLVGDPSNAFAGDAQGGLLPFVTQALEPTVNAVRLKRANTFLFLAPTPDVVARGLRGASTPTGPLCPDGACSTPAPDAPERFRRLHAATQTLASVSLTERVRVLQGTDCSLGVCELQSTIVESSGTRAHLRSWTSGGQTMFRIVQTYEANQVTGALFLFPSGVPSYAVLLEGEPDKEAFALYTPDGRRIGAVPVASFARDAWIEKAKGFVPAAAVATEGAANKTPVAVFCEGFFTPQPVGPARGRPDELAALVRGPHAAEPTRAGYAKSLTGWHPNPYGARATFWDGLHSSLFGYFHGPGYVAPGDHGNAVVTSFLSLAPGGKAVPIGGPDVCLPRFTDDWGPVVRQTLPNARVVNLSWVTILDRESCKPTVDATMGSPLGESFLWVMAAGNEGDANPADRCPHGVRRPNTIVVTSASEGKLAKMVDHGDRYADLAAALDDAPYPEGTSFAAPRVTAVAARLFATHPAWSAAAVREVLLTSVTLGRQGGALQPLVPTRSGGILEPARAEALAACIAERGGGAGPLSAGELVPCFRSVFRESEAAAKQRYDFFKGRTGVLYGP